MGKKVFAKLSIVFSLGMVLVLFQHCMPGPSELRFNENITDPDAIPLPAPVQSLLAPLPQASYPGTSSDLLGYDILGHVPLRRLTSSEVKKTLQNIFSLTPSSSALALLPNDIMDETISPFKNVASLQSVNPSFIENLEGFAETYSGEISSSNARIDQLAGCSPASVRDENCFKSFAQKIGRLMLRKRITTSELSRYLVLLSSAEAEDDYYVAPRLLLKYFLMSPEFIYKIEAGQSVQGKSLRELNPYEIASRMAFFIWGSGPDTTLLDAADRGELKDQSSRIAEAQRMMNDPKARSHWREFHADWLGFGESVLPSNLQADMLQESHLLVDKITSSITEDWLNLFTSDESYLTPTLAAHYGLAPPTYADWVQLPNERAAGILSHASFLAQGAKFGDTSPTLRGYKVLKRILCQKLGPVPDSIDPDNPPPSSPGTCKESAYYMRTVSSCSSCHKLTDNIGFGLENFSANGTYRISEAGKPNCAITGEGGVGTVAFTGARELGRAIASEPAAIACASRQLVRSLTGREDSSKDNLLVSALHAQYNETPQFQSMVLSLVASPGFIHQ